MAQAAESKEEVINQNTEENSAPKWKVSDIYDHKQEEKLLETFIELALEPNDKTWTMYNKGIKGLEVSGKYADKESLCTIRGRMSIENTEVRDLYTLYEPGNKDCNLWEKNNDKMCTEIREVAAIDSKHSIIYGSYSSGFPSWVIAPRDFYYISRRGILYNYKVKDKLYKEISYTMGYSIENIKHPFYVKLKDGHVRGILKYGGIVFVKDGNNSCKIIYLVHLDPKGYLPSYVVNLVASDQGMIAKQIHDNWKNALKLLEKRKDKEYKKDAKYLFDNDKCVLHKNEIKSNENDNNNNKEKEEEKEKE